MKLNLLNESTANGDGHTWFKTILRCAHAYWPSCSECGKRTDVYWHTYPNNGKLICENCIEFKEKE